MDPATLTAIIGGGASLASTGLGALNTGSMNKKTREWNETMYNRQLEDNRANWQMQWDKSTHRSDILWQRQNEYDSPRAQMQRFQEAGLNPNLIYGQQITGQQASAPPSSAPQGASPKNLDMKRTDFSGLNRAGDSLMNMYDIRMKSAQIQGQMEHNRGLAADANLKEQEYENRALNNPIKTGINKQTLANITQDFNLKYNKDQREAILANKSVEKMAIEMASIDSKIKLTNAQVNEISQRMIESNKRIEKMNAEIQYMPYNGSNLGIALKSATNLYDDAQSYIRELKQRAINSLHGIRSKKDPQGGSNTHGSW